MGPTLTALVNEGSSGLGWGDPRHLLSPAHQVMRAQQRVWPERTQPVRAWSELRGLVRVAGLGVRLLGVRLGRLALEREGDVLIAVERDRAGAAAVAVLL